MGTKRYDIQEREYQPCNSEAKLLYVSYSKYDKDWYSLPHTHSFVELFYVLSGTGKFLISHNYYPVAAGSLILINSNVPHTETSGAEEPMEYIVIGISGLTSISKTNPKEEFQLFHLDDRENSVKACLSMMLREAKSKKSRYTEVCYHVFEVLLIQLHRQLDMPSRPLVHEASSRGKATQIKYYIENHFHEDINLTSLAQRVQVSKYYLAHTFCQYFGMSPMQYVQSLRLNESRTLLRTTSFSVKKIAAIVGYSSYGYFVQRFIKAEGISPEQYRELSQASPGDGKKASSPASEET